MADSRSEANAGLPPGLGRGQLPPPAPAAPGSSERLTSVLFLESTLESIRPRDMFGRTRLRTLAAKTWTRGKAAVSAVGPSPGHPAGCLPKEKDTPAGCQQGPIPGRAPKGPCLPRPDGLLGLASGWVGAAGRGQQGPSASLLLQMCAATSPDHTGW